MNSIGPYTELNRPRESGGRTALGDIIALVEDEMAEGPKSFDQMLQGNQDQLEEMQATLPEASQSVIAPGRLPGEMASMEVASQVKVSVSEEPSGEYNPNITTSEPSLDEVGLPSLPSKDSAQVSADEQAQPHPPSDPVAALPSMIAPVAAESSIVLEGEQPVSVTANLGGLDAEQARAAVGTAGLQTEAAAQRFGEKTAKGLPVQIPSLNIEGDITKPAVLNAPNPQFLNASAPDTTQTPDTTQAATLLGSQQSSSGNVALPFSLGEAEIPREHDVLVNKALVKKVLGPDAETKGQGQARLMTVEPLISFKPQEKPSEEILLEAGLATRPITTLGPVILPETDKINRLTVSEGFSGTLDVKPSPETFVLKFNPEGAEKPEVSGTRLDEGKGAGGLVQPLSAKLEMATSEQSNAKPAQEPQHPNAQVNVLRATMALNMRDAQWGQKLVAQIEKMQNEGVARYDISLRPKNLGDLQVSLEFRGEETQVRIVTETTSASRVLIGAEDRLAQMLDNAGFRLTSFAASMSAGQQNGGAGHGHNPKQKQNSAELANKNKGARNASTSAPMASAETKSHNGAVNVIA